MENCLEKSVNQAKKVIDGIIDDLSLNVTAATYQRSLLVLSLNNLDRIDNKIYSNVIKIISKLLNLDIGTIRYKVYETGHTPDRLLAKINTVEALHFLQNHIVDDQDAYFVNKISDVYIIKENNYKKVKTMNTSSGRRVVKSKSNTMNKVAKSYIEKINTSLFNYKRNYQLAILLLTISEYRYLTKKKISQSMLALAINEVAYELDLSTNTIRDNIYSLNLTSKEFVSNLENDLSNNTKNVLNLFENNLKKDMELFSVKDVFDKDFYLEVENNIETEPATVAKSKLSQDIKLYLSKLNNDCSVGTYHRLLFVMRLNMENNLDDTSYLNSLDDVSAYTGKAKSTISDKYTRCINLNKDGFLNIYKSGLENVRVLFKEFAVEEFYDKDLNNIDYVFNNLLK